MQIHPIDLGFLDLKEAIATFLIEGPDGLVLIESGPHSTFDQLEAGLGNHGYKVSDISTVLLTHIHFDHAGAAWALAREGAKVYVHPKGFKHLASPERLYQSAKMIYGDRMETLWGAMEAIPEDRMYVPEHGEKVQVGGLEFTAWYTPGHASHHIAWQLGKEVLFSGDVAGVRIGTNGPVMPPCPPPDIDVEAWQESIALIRDLPVSRLYLTHFGPSDDKQKLLDELEKSLLDWAAFIKPYFERQADQKEIVPEFVAYVKNQLHSRGLSESEISKYEAANPAFMSVAGLMRYWKKKTEKDAQS